MTLKTILKNDFDLDLPISGGSGLSIDDPVVIERSGINDYVSTEHTLLKYLAKKRQVQYELVGQALLSHQGRRLDRITIQTIDSSTEGVRGETAHYYFDITDCFPVSIPKDVNFNEAETLNQIVARMNALQQATEFNWECIARLKNRQLWDDVPRLLAFTEVMLSDEPLASLFDAMMSQRKQAIMSVLDRVAGQIE